MNVNAPNFDIFRRFPIINELNIAPAYTLAYGYQTVAGSYVTYESTSPLPCPMRKSVGSSGDDFLLMFVAQAEHVTPTGLEKYGKTINQLPIRFANVALSLAVEVKILPGKYPDGICLFSLDLGRWISAIKSNLKAWNLVQERGQLTEGVYRDDDMVILAFDTCGLGYPPDAYYIDGVRISADKLLRQLEATKEKISRNRILIHDQIKLFPAMWRGIKAMFART